MGHWTKNTLVVTGAAEPVKSLRDAVSGIDMFGETSFFAASIVVRPPDEYIVAASIGKTPESWDVWAWDNWGFVREVFATLAEEDLGEEGFRLTYTFETASGSAMPLARVLVAQHPDVRIHLRYVDEGLACGQLEGKGGVVTRVEVFEEPTSHGQSMAQSGECWCSRDLLAFPDCLRANGVALGLGDDVIAIAEELEEHVMQGDALNGDSMTYFFEVAQGFVERGFGPVQLEALLSLLPDWEGQADQLLDALATLE